jgi:hypothetical protein
LSFHDRKQLILALEGTRQSKVLSYFLSDRETYPTGFPGFLQNLTNEPQLLFWDQLESLGKPKKLDLFLYTRGGNTDSIWPLISMLREKCERLSVIIPFKAHSGGTLIAFGADEILMTELAQLSPIDPTTGNQFNPIDPTNQRNRLGISVEDVRAYFDLSTTLGGIKEESSKLEVFKQLTGSGSNSVHPLALGNVHRVTKQIEELAQQLLALHIDKKENEKKIKGITKAFISEFYSHLHAISRKEAIAVMGDWVKAPTEQENLAIMNLFNSYVTALELRKKFSVPDYMGEDIIKELTVIGGFLESTELQHVYLTKLKLVQKPVLPPNMQIQVPPGQSIPLVPWAPRAVDITSIRDVGWQINSDGV